DLQHVEPPSPAHQQVVVGLELHQAARLAERLGDLGFIPVPLRRVPPDAHAPTPDTSRTTPTRTPDAARRAGRPSTARPPARSRGACSDDIRRPRGSFIRPPDAHHPVIAAPVHYFALHHFGTPRKPFSHHRRSWRFMPSCQ